MKKFFPLFALLTALSLGGSFLVSCKSPPPPAEEPSLPPPSPPSPPPPPPEPEAEPEAEPDTAGPELKVTLSAEYFSPDDDGMADVLDIALEARDESDIWIWQFDIFDPNNRLFRRWTGEVDTFRDEAAAESAKTALRIFEKLISWDGRGLSGELIQSASDYPFVFTAADVFNNSSTSKGIIQIDVLVIKEGDILRVQVPSIVFASNSVGFDGLSEEDKANNDWILRRIAQVLQKFSGYHVTVEGHANYTVSPAQTRQRQRESQELRALSQARAGTIVNYLAGLGVERERLSSVGIGGDRPIVAFEDRDNWWKNRRVEFILER
jgi:outer membrane protein OmpA-like peptidoglycan-associated protein